MSRSKKDDMFDDVDLFDNVDEEEENVEDQPSPEDPNDPYRNLVYEIDDIELSTLGHEILQGVNDDLTSRQKWDNKVNSMLKQLNIIPEDLETDSDDFAPLFNGASSLHSTILLEIYIGLFNAITQELLRQRGPVNTEVLGEATKSMLDKADRIKLFLNYYLTIIYKDYYTEKTRNIIWSLLTGSSFTKIFIDPISNKPISKFVSPFDFIINSNAISIVDCSRYAEKVTYTQKEFELLKLNQFFKVPDSENFIDENTDEADSQVKKTLENISGVEINEKGNVDIYICYVDLNLKKHPYLNIGDLNPNQSVPFTIYITTNGIVLRICQNWKMNDPLRRKINIYEKYEFMPGFSNFYGIGLMHLILNQSEGSTVLLRQMLDANTLSNFPGGFVNKDMKISKHTFQMNPMEFTPIEMSGDDINKQIMTLPFKEASPMSMELKNSLENGARAIAGDLKLDLENIKSNTPATTLLAVLEHLNIDRSSILGRYYNSFGEELRKIYNVFKEYISENPISIKVAQKAFKISLDDFDNDIRVIPVADPNLSSSALRMIRAESVYTVAKENPEMFNMYAVVKNYLEAQKVLNIDTILIAPEEGAEEAVPLDPLSENANAMQSLPLKAAMWQDHAAHISVHRDLIDKINNQILEATPDVINALQAHINEHQVFAYMASMEASMNRKLPEDPSMLTPEEQNEFSKEQAQAIMTAQQEAQEQMGPQPTMEQLGMEQVQVEKEKNMLKAQELQLKANIEQSKLMQKEKEIATNAALEQQKIATEAEIKHQTNMVNQYDNETKRMHELEIARTNNIKTNVDLSEKNAKMNLDNAKLEQEAVKTDAEISKKRAETEKLIKDIIE